MVGDSTTRRIYLDAHADLVAVGEHLVLVLVDKVRVDELEPEPKRVCVVLDKENKSLAVTRYAFDKYPLSVNP